MDRGRAVTIVGYPEKRPIDKVCHKAENMGIYNVESEKRGVAYMYDSGEIAIVTSRGHVMMSFETAETLVEELFGLIKDIKDLRRMQCRK